jgi:hypothetical protein
VLAACRWITKKINARARNPFVVIVANVLPNANADAKTRNSLFDKIKK